ncbi:MAG: transposase, partial [Chloroflexi bacterium]|nr:transposase [Chloroflexota bacterium]
MWDRGAIRLGYHDHDVIDRGQAPHHPRRPGHPGGRHGEPGDAGSPLAGLLPAEDLAPPRHGGCQVRHHRKHRRHQGCRYSGFRAADRRRAPHRSYGQDDFVFDPERDEYRCLQGHPLSRYSTKRTEGVVAYRGEAAICNACPIKAECTTSDHSRKVQRSIYADYLEKVRAYHATEAY